MLRFIYGQQLCEFPALAASMFRDRARQFSERLQWDVHVDAQGWEKDEYDGLNPIYIIYEAADGSHAGSTRFLPTVGRVMVNEHFMDLTRGVPIKSPLIWECTRFCISPRTRTGAHIPAALTLAAAEMAKRFALNHIVAVFDARMVKIYRSLAWSPEIIGTSGQGRSAVSVGLWDASDIPIDTLRTKAKVSAPCMDRWFRQSFEEAREASLSA